MTAPPPKIPPVPGKSLAFSIEEDGYVRVQVDDGAVLRLRPVVVDVRDAGRANAEGEKVYEVASFVHVVVERPATAKETA